MLTSINILAQKEHNTSGSRHSSCSKFKGGNISLKSIKVRNVQSDMRSGKKLVAFAFQCLSAERSVVHNLYMVFENSKDGGYVPSPCSYCGCENGAFFCSHMLCFLHHASIIQRCNMTQEEIEKVMPVDRRLSQNIPCLLANLALEDKMNRQKAQRNRHKRKEPIIINNLDVIINLCTMLVPIIFCNFN